MTLTLELTPDEERRLQGARTKGIDVLTLLKGVIASLPEVSATSADRTAELFAQWDSEDAEMTPEDVAEAQTDWKSFQDNLNAHRALTGEEPLF